MFLITLALAACAAPPAATPPPEPQPEDTALPADTVLQDTALPWSPDAVLGAPAQLSSRGPITCPSPELRDQLGPFRVQAIPVRTTGEEMRFHVGPVVADLNADGVPDLLVSDGREAFRAYQSDGYEFRDVTDLTFHAPISRVTGGVAVDFNDDGFQDVLLTRMKAAPVLMTNERGVLTDISTDAGLIGPTGQSFGAAWADVNGDGLLDLYVGAYGKINNPFDPDHLGPATLSAFYLRQADGTLTLADAELPHLARQGWTFTPSFIDIDNDGDQDLYQINDFGTQVLPNQLLLNDGQGNFAFAPSGSGLDIPLEGMGVSFADLNGDQVPDAFVPSWGSVALMLSTPVGRWVNVATARGVQPDAARNQTVAWGGNFADFDNDGRLDLYVPYGYTAADTPNNTYINFLNQPNAMLLQQPDGQFADVGPAWGVDFIQSARGSQVADLNRDGWPDIVIANHMTEPNQVLFSRCGDAAWASFELAQPAPNVGAIGARIHIEGQGLNATSWVQAGGTSFSGSAPAERHFGLGDRETIERLEVRWPDGQMSTFLDVPARHHWVVTRAP